MSRQGNMDNGTSATGTRDEAYNLISVLYHLLSGIETYGKYSEDAQQRGDRELVLFFGEVQQHHRQLADRAKRLLSHRLLRGDGPADRPDAVDEASMESFPASDPPSH